MSQAAPKRRYAIPILATAGGMLVLVGVVAGYFWPLEPAWVSLQPWFLTAGSLLALAALLGGRLLPTALMMGCGVSVWTLLLMVGFAELAFQWVGFDFRGAARTQSRLPPFYRQPTAPSGTVFFRRPGPEVWSGQPIQTWLRLAGISASNVYESEPVITVRYDSLGFRDGEGLSNWEVAIAGDSFVELGCLSHDQLFTTLLGRYSDRRIRNLGASNTGPFTHLHYLETYGLSEGLQTSVIVFYEGNDLQDIGWEKQAMEFYERTGKRGYRRIRPQPSLVAALYEAWHRPASQRGPAESIEEVRLFESRDGPIPVTILPLAPHPRDLTRPVMDAWETFLVRYREFGLRNHVEVWLAYMPCKARVLHGAIRPLPGAGSFLPEWEPTPLPGWVQEACQRHGIAFLDLTPALRLAVQVERFCLYNPMVDTHLNAEGSANVARELGVRLFGLPHDTPLIRSRSSADQQPGPLVGHHGPWQSEMVEQGVPKRRAGLERSGNLGALEVIPPDGRRINPEGESIGVPPGGLDGGDRTGGGQATKTHQTREDDR